MTEKIKIPGPTDRINILKRYLHILALLQNNKDPQEWNGRTLASILFTDEDPNSKLNDKNIRDYINNNLIVDLEEINLLY